MAQIFICGPFFELFITLQAVKFYNIVHIYI